MHSEKPTLQHNTEELFTKQGRKAAETTLTSGSTLWAPCLFSPPAPPFVRAGCGSPHLRIDSLARRLSLSHFRTLKARPESQPSGSLIHPQIHPPPPAAYPGISTLYPPGLFLWSFFSLEHGSHYLSGTTKGFLPGDHKTPSHTRWQMRTD